MDGQRLSGDVENIVQFVVFSYFPLEIHIRSRGAAVDRAKLTISHKNLDRMDVTDIDCIAVVESSLIAPEPSVDVFLDAPVVLLSEDDDVCTLVDPLDRDDGVAASIYFVGPEGGERF